MGNGWWWDLTTLSFDGSWSEVDNLVDGSKILSSVEQTGFCLVHSVSCRVCICIVHGVGPVHSISCRMDGTCPSYLFVGFIQVDLMLLGLAACVPDELPFSSCLLSFAAGSPIVGSPSFPSTCSLARFAPNSGKGELGRECFAHGGIGARLR